MNNITKINAEIQKAPQTVINKEILAASGAALESGALILEKYRVEKKLDVLAGEADLYICDYGGKQFAAKLYKREIAIKDEVIEALKKIDSPYVARLYESGIHNARPFEILPYYKNGSLQGKRFPYDELKKIIGFINEGLKVIHDSGIIHKDLKPSNIMLSDDKESVAIIDFGISSFREGGNAIVVTRTGMTPEYSAPETFRNIFLVESDYYSFGVTIYELFTGSTPYAGMEAEEIELYHSVQRIPFPKDMPLELQNLISALTYNDITERNNKANPNRRWTYEEVNGWLNGEIRELPGGTKKEIPAYKFMGNTFNDPLKLVEALAGNWEEGKRHLFRGRLTKYFHLFDPVISAACSSAENEAVKISGKDDKIIWKLLYKMNPGSSVFYWLGNSFENLPALGRVLLDSLWKSRRDLYPFYGSILRERLLSEYPPITASKNEKMKKNIADIENMFLIAKNDAELEFALYMLAYLLSNQRVLSIDNMQFNTVGEFADYMRKLLDKSFDEFNALCHTLVDYKGNLNTQLEAWLTAIGKGREIGKWREALKEGN
jgi:hypothetical protein